MNDYQSKIILYGTRLIIIFLIIPIHEFAHAWSANKLGDDTPRYQGRLTLNPIAHIDIFGAICLFFTGFGWGKPVVINPIRFKKRSGVALTAAAGPISNIIVAFVAMIIFKIFLAMLPNISLNSDTLVWFYFILQQFIMINIGLAAFNLLPIPPLDGSKIVAFFSSKYDRFIKNNSYYITIILFVLIIASAGNIPVIGHVLDYPIVRISNLLWWCLDKLTFWEDIIIKAVINR